MSKDRLSIHQDSGGPLIQEAFSIMRDGGTAVQSGLIGVTNIGYIPGSEPVIPETIFNVQSSGASYIRFSSGPSSPTNLCNDSAIQIFGNGNARASGLQIKYKPYNDTATVDYCVDENCLPPSIKYKQYSLQKCSDNSSDSPAFLKLSFMLCLKEWKHVFFVLIPMFVKYLLNHLEKVLE